MENLAYVTPVSMRDEGVENHLVDLRNRFQDLRKQHDTIVEKSMNIIHEICGVSMKLKNNFETEEHEFEYELGKKSKKEPSAIKIAKNLDDRKIVDSFEKLNQSNTLQYGLLLFNRTKDNMRQIDEFLDEITKDIKFRSPNGLWLKTNFDCSKRTTEYPMNFNGVNSAMSGISVKSCFSSTISLNGFKSIEDFGQPLKEDCYASPSCFDMGYQGDLDESEHDLHASRKVEK